VELKLLVKFQAQKIAELEVACVDLKRANENVTAGYKRLAEKHKTFTEKAEREKTELAKTHAMELARIQVELDEETRGYIDYHLNMCESASRPPYGFWRIDDQQLEI
jgi:hypothetical protein